MSDDIQRSVEAGARAWHARNQAARKDAGRFADDGGPFRWEHLTETDQRAYLALAREIVTPALAILGIGEAAA